MKHKAKPQWHKVVCTQIGARPQLPPPTSELPPDANDLEPRVPEPTIDEAGPGKRPRRPRSRQRRPGTSKSKTDAKKLDRMERECDRRAVEGNLRPIYYKGQRVGAVREYSDNLLMFRMKALASNKYRDNATVEIELGKRSLADLFNAEDR